jgi:hypothetical protein
LGIRRNGRGWTCQINPRIPAIKLLPAPRVQGRISARSAAEAAESKAVNVLPVPEPARSLRASAGPERKRLRRQDMAQKGSGGNAGAVKSKGGDDGAAGSTGTGGKGGGGRSGGSKSGAGKTRGK